MLLAQNPHNNAKRRTFYTKRVYYTLGKLHCNNFKKTYHLLTTNLETSLNEQAFIAEGLLGEM